MQFIITDVRLARSRAVHLTGSRLVLSLIGVSLMLMVLAAAMYHWVFLKGAREGWPLVGTLVRLIVKDEFEQRERFMRENIDAMARKLGEMQAKLVQLEALGERVSGLAGVDPAPLRSPPARGGALVSGQALTLHELQAALDAMDRQANQSADWLTVVEARLFDSRVHKMMLPTQLPVPTGTLGSPFGWRIDPFTGQRALHTGLDFQAETGTPILAAAGGVVVNQSYHPAYGNLIEIDHGNDLITRYAHASRVHVKQGDLVRRGQKIAEVGSTGRSTGPHLHFEVLVAGVYQDPRRFLDAGSDLATRSLAQAGPSTVGAAPGAAVATVPTR